jgi:hypothetical protein
MLSSGAVSWSSKKQLVVSLSTTEAECLWLVYPPPKLSTSLLPHVLVSAILCDNNSSKKLSKNLVLHDKSKHIDIRFHFLRELVKDSVVNLSHCNTQDQVANIMTKPRLEVFLKLRSLLGIYEVPNIN